MEKRGYKLGMLMTSSITLKTRAGEAIQVDDETTRRLLSRAAKDPATAARLIRAHGFALVRWGAEWVAPEWWAQRIATAAAALEAA